MQLRYSPTSPYVRKVMVTALETGLDKKLEKIPTNPWDPETDLPEDNPIGKVPALRIDGGDVLFDSPVICEYLDGQHGGAKLFPASGDARWSVLRLQALADGILDAAVLCVLEGKRPKELQSKDWVARQKKAIERSLDALEQSISGLDVGQLTIAQIAAGCALGYLDFRKPVDDWRKGRPKLEKWYEEFSKRPSMQATVPKDPA
ncbi:MAG TPA: glutathione S-transferase N-terminal domain-containing protein [Gammaproteobacteria bacterium]|nr:glutathione S-transferase N-terminal domain-containing protein [Gammaproteobacteria bacterium]